MISFGLMQKQQTLHSFIADVKMFLKILLLFEIVFYATKTNGFVPHQDLGKIKKLGHRKNASPHHDGFLQLSKISSSKTIIENNLHKTRPTRSFELKSQAANDKDFSGKSFKNGRLSTSLSFCLAAGAWIALSVKALSYHPDPRFINCSIKHNILTMSQAFAFPLPILLAAMRAAASDFHKSTDIKQPALHFGIATTFVYLALTTFFAPAFAFGYDLYPTPIKLLAGCIFSILSIKSFENWKKMDFGFQLHLPNSSTFLSTSSIDYMYLTGCIGMLWFAFAPLVSDYPLVTIPSILGKRLSRSAGAFTWLASVMCYSLKKLRRNGQRGTRTFNILRTGLGLGSLLHCSLILLKLIGIDDGGFLLKGQGLWENYPAMLAVPFATTCSLMVHSVIIIATLFLK